MVESMEDTPPVSKEGEAQYARYGKWLNNLTLVFCFHDGDFEQANLSRNGDSAKVWGDSGQLPLEGLVDLGPDLFVQSLFAPKVDLEQSIAPMRLLPRQRLVRGTKRIMFAAFWKTVQGA